MKNHNNKSMKSNPLDKFNKDTVVFESKVNKPEVHKSEDINDDLPSAL
jgi:hypothetical protein